MSDTESNREPLPAAPAKQLAIVTCMDARLNPSTLLGLEEGDAHVIRNAGGIVTDDVIRSLALSQCALGTRAIMVIQHTRCGLLDSEANLQDTIEQEAGTRPTFPLGAFSDLEESVRQSMARVKASPVIPHTDVVRGYVYELETRSLREVS